MSKLERIGLILIILALSFASMRNIKAQASTGDMKTFYDSEIAGLHIQVNATAKTQPLGSITVLLNLKRQAVTIYLESFNLRIYGYINGTYEIMMDNKTGGNFQLTEYSLNFNVLVPKQVWGVTRGEITLDFNVTYTVGSGFLTMPYRNITIGFQMTNVENVYLKSIEEELESLKDEYNQLNITLAQLNETFWEGFHLTLTVENLAYVNRTLLELEQNYTALQGSLNELDTTRRVAAILTVTTVFFVATTLYMILWKPKEYY